MFKSTIEHGGATESSQEVPRSTRGGIRNNRACDPLTPTAEAHGSPGGLRPIPGSHSFLRIGGRDLYGARTEGAPRLRKRGPAPESTRQFPTALTRNCAPGNLRGPSVVKLCCTAALLLFTLSLNAQSLDSLRILLRENNPALQSLAYRYRAESTLGRQERQLPDVQISGGVSPMPLETRLGPQLARVGVTQMLPWPGSLAARAALADARARPLLEEAAARQLELIFALETTYFGIAEAEATIATLRTSLELYGSLRQIALRRVEASRGSTVDVYRAELETNATQRRIRELEREQTLAWIRIEELVNSPLPRLLVPPPPQPLPPVAEDSLYTDNPLVRIYALQEEISRRSLAVNDLDARPDFAVGLDYMVIGKRTDMDPPGNGRNMVMPHAMVTFPISGARYDARREEEELRLRTIDADRRMVVNELRAAVEAARTSAADAADRLTFLADQITLTEAALEIARSEYANGQRPFDELLRLQNELLDYRIEALAAERSLLTQTATVDRYLPRR